MKKFSLCSGIIALMLLIAAGCSQPEQHTEGEDSGALDQLFSDYKSYIFYTYPEYATYNGVHEHNDRLADQSVAAGDRYLDSLDGIREALTAMDREGLSDDDIMNYDLFLYSLNTSIDMYSFDPSKYLVFSQQSGYHVTFPQIIETQPFKTEEDIENYFSRLKGFPEQADNVIAMLRQGHDKNIMPYCAVSEQVLKQLESFAGMTPETSPLYTAKEKSEVLAARSDELLQIVSEYIAPAYQELYNFYKDEYHGDCRSLPGISSVKDGKEYYEYLVRYYTTSNMTPDEVFNIGMSEVDRIRAEMLTTRDEMGYEDMELTDFFEHLRTSPEYYFSEKEALMNGYREILDKMDARLPDLFGTLPESPYDLKEIEEYRAASAPTAYYYPVPDDGSRPGYFYVNTYDLNSRPIYTMTALALHEAVPGHHLQIALATELEDVPWFRNQMSVTAFVEGWGLYAEYLGYESGMYDDPLQKMGALSFEMWRACRLVVDVGMHYKGWSKEEAFDFLKSNAPLAEHDINSEIDRYISWPGQALAYKIGELKLKELRQKAEEQLGDAFDIREFHDAVLLNGAIPLQLLEENIDAWIAEKQSA